MILYFNTEGRGRVKWQFICSERGERREERRPAVIERAVCYLLSGREGAQWLLGERERESGSVVDQTWDGADLGLAWTEWCVGGGWLLYTLITLPALSQSGALSLVQIVQTL